MHLIRKLAIASLPIITTLLIAVWAVPAYAASASTTSAWTTTPQCVVHSTHSMVEMGFGATESSIADVIQVECRPVYSQSPVTITADELNSRCHDTLSWFSPSSGTGAGESFDVLLDNDGNAEATVWGGPSCAAGTSLITASLDVSPFTTVKTTFTVLAPRNTTPGVTAHPSTEVEDATTSSVETVIQVEFPSVHAEQFVKISSPELNARCAGGVTWIGPDEAPFGTGASTFVQLDDNGNAFVVAEAGPSCASGTSTIEASLISAPFTTYTTTFKILSPRPTCTKLHCS